MCLIGFAVDAHPRWRFVLAGNRDEFHARPTAAAGPLDTEGQRLGGRDLQAGGGWLQADAWGRVAAVTNVRHGPPMPAPRSRGALVADFIAGEASASAYLDGLAPAFADFGRFNLLVWDARHGAAHYASNHPTPYRHAVSPGVHALSNADLGTPWPKTRALQGRLAAWLAKGDRRDPHEPEVGAPLFEALADRQEAPDAALPDTGIDPVWERRLSAAFIVGEDYGTRASTLVLVDATGLWFEERRFGPGGVATGREAFWLPRPQPRAPRSGVVAL